MTRRSPISKRGFNTDTAPGKKPAVALKNEELSKDNLNLKVKILLGYISDLEIGIVRDFNMGIPMTQRQFHLWECEDPKYGKVNKNGRLTFLKYPEIVLSVTQLLKKISELHRENKIGRSSSENLAAARRSSALHKTMRQICERELIRSRATLGKISKELDVAKAKYASLEKASKEAIEGLRSEISDLQLENQRLIKQHRNVVGIGVKK